MRSIFPVLILILSIACGGGGGGGDASTTSTSTATINTDSFFVVKYSEQNINSPSLSGEFTTSFSKGSLTGVEDSTRTIQAVAMASETEVKPELHLALKTGNISTTVNSKYNIAVYGLYNSTADVMVGMYQVDFSTSPATVTIAGGLSTTNSQSLLDSGLITGILELKETGRATYDNNWSGAFSSDAKTFLLTNSTDGKLVMLGSKVETHTASEIEGTRTSVVIMQYADPVGSTNSSQITAASAAGPVIYRDSITSPDLTYTRSNNDVNVPSGSRKYNLSTEDTSIIEIRSTDNNALTESGYIGASKFFVVLNPDSITRPAFSIIFL
jgi:hypothetical protein